MKNKKTKLCDELERIYLHSSFKENPKFTRLPRPKHEQDIYLPSEWRLKIISHICSKAHLFEYFARQNQPTIKTQKCDEAKKISNKIIPYKIIYQNTLNTKPIFKKSLLREEKKNYSSHSEKENSASLSLISHELRTPLNSILVLAEQFCKNPENNLNEQQLIYAKAIKDNGHALLKILSDYIEMSRIVGNSDAGGNFTENIAQTLSKKNFSNLITSEFIDPTKENLPATIDHKKPQLTHEKNDEKSAQKKEIFEQHSQAKTQNKIVAKHKLVIFDIGINSAKRLNTIAIEKGYDTLIIMELDLLFEALYHSNTAAIFLEINTLESLGWKALKHIKNSFQFRGIPIYLSTPNHLQKILLKKGINAFIKDINDMKELEQLLLSISKNSNSTSKNLLFVDVRTNKLENFDKKFSIEGLSLHIAKSLSELRQKLKEHLDIILILDQEAQDWGKEAPKYIRSIAPNCIILFHSTTETFPERTKKNPYLKRQTASETTHSIDQLLDETLLAVHFNHKHLSSEKKRVLENIRMKNDVLSGKTILIVDDDVRNVFAINTVLERFNINVISADSGQAALKLLNENKNIDMLLMDMLMPGMSGYQTIKKLRSQNTKPHLPIIALTAMTMQGDKKKCLDAGANDYISKPIKMDFLLWKMRNHFLK